MKLIEYRVVMPLTVEEYQVGQTYSTARMSKNESGGGDGVEVLVNEPFTGKPLFHGEYSSGQYTKKIYYAKKKVNGVVRTLLPPAAMVGVEDAWNAFPYCRTIIKNEYMGEDFELKIETLHLPGRGEIENAHKLTSDELKRREVILIDITEDVAPSDYKASDDPVKYTSKKKRGPLKKLDWMGKANPVMTAYKLVHIKFKWFGLQSMVEGKLVKAEKRIFTLFHRQMWCWQDEWLSLTIEEARDIEKEMHKELKQEIAKEQVKGMAQEV